MDADETQFGNLRPLVETLPAVVAKLLHTREGLSELTVGYIRHCHKYGLEAQKEQLAFWRRCFQFFELHPMEQIAPASEEDLKNYFERMVS